MRRAAAAMAMALSVLLVGTVDADTWTVVQWNLMSGWGKAGTAASCPFQPGPDCAVNAWGNGAGPLARTLGRLVRDDPGVVALAVMESWSCATPGAIRAVLGAPWGVAPWPGGAAERGGVALLVRHGLAGRTEEAILPRCGGAEERRILRAPVYLDAARSRVLPLYATHWTGCAAEVDATAAFLARGGRVPVLLVGDLNVKDSTSSLLAPLAGLGFTDLWPALHGAAPGYTGIWNREWGSPRGNLYKRIDYVLARGVRALALDRVNHDAAPGACVVADHAGLVLRAEGLPRPARRAR